MSNGVRAIPRLGVITGNGWYRSHNKSSIVKLFGLVLCQPIESRRLSLSNQHAVQCQSPCRTAQIIYNISTQLPVVMEGVFNFDLRSNVGLASFPAAQKEEQRTELSVFCY